MTNEELILKARIETSAIATAGKLNPEQANQFITYLYDMTMLKGSARLVRFTNESMQIDKLAVHTRVAVPKVEARSVQLRRGVTPSRVTIQPVDITCPWEISDNFGDYNIEGEAVTNTIMRLMATQFGNDIEELLIDGNTVGPARLASDMYEGGSATQVVLDSYIALFNGWLRLADSGNVYDAEGADISQNIFSKMMLSLPEKFRRVRTNMRFLTSMDHEQLYRERIGARQTSMGDNALTESGNIRVFGVPIVPVPMLNSEPRIVENVTFAAAPTTQTLTYKPIGTTLYITPTTLNASPRDPYVEGGASDYTVNRTTGVITTVGGGAMAAGGTFKVTYHSQGMALLTDFQNLIFAIGRDIMFEKDRDIMAALNQFVIHARVACQLEEVTAVVKGINIGLE